MFITAEVRMMTPVIKIKKSSEDTDQTSPSGGVCVCVSHVTVALGQIFPLKDRI